MERDNKDVFAKGDGVGRNGWIVRARVSTSWFASAFQVRRETGIQIDGCEDESGEYGGKESGCFTQRKDGEDIQSASGAADDALHGDDEQEPKEKKRREKNRRVAL
eukprot:TRINITY_DN3421_c0_g1_i4.p1 TRINITY_DN3421_c0_g1~~TRINITY_DN3421_c0_g1_i4.p1  ORF type:complete len:106 (+),score=15.08 TRINITY_DN3421_c0_g1_i4:216-533(+)